MTRNIAPSYEELRRLELQCREECQPFIDEMVRIQSMSIRPMWMVLGSNKIEYGPYPEEVQGYLDKLQAMIDETVERYKLHCVRLPWVPQS